MCLSPFPSCRIAVSGRQFVTSSTLVIGLEVHLLEGQTEAADPFNAFIRIDTGGMPRPSLLTP